MKLLEVPFCGAKEIVKITKGRTVVSMDFGDLKQLLPSSVGKTIRKLGNFYSRALVVKSILLIYKKVQICPFPTPYLCAR